jgi:hypothetical protein
MFFFVITFIQQLTIMFNTNVCPMLEWYTRFVKTFPLFLYKLKMLTKITSLHFLWKFVSSSPTFFFCWHCFKLIIAPMQVNNNEWRRYFHWWKNYNNWHFIFHEEMCPHVRSSIIHDSTKENHIRNKNLKNWFRLHLEHCLNIYII